MKRTHPSNRTEFTQLVRTGIPSRKRLVVLGKPGSGRFTALKLALNACEFEIYSMDLIGLRFSSEVDQVFSSGPNLEALDRVAKDKKIALILRNIDGCVGLDDESAIVGRLRNYLQSVHHLAIFYTAADSGFVDRNFLDRESSFFKQAVVVPTPILEEDDLTHWVDDIIKTSLSLETHDFIVQEIGLFPAHLHVLINTLASWHAAKKMDNKRITLDETNNAVQLIVDSRSHLYETFLRISLTASQRAVLAAFAEGTPLRATKAMQRASGVLTRSLPYFIKSLRNNLIIDGDNEPRFADPFLRFYLRNRRQGFTNY